MTFQKPDMESDDSSVFLAMLIKCGYTEELLRVLPKLPTKSLLLFALLDDKRFQVQVESILEIPNLANALNILRKRKLNLSDFQFLIEFSRQTPEKLEKIYLGIVHYNLHKIAAISVGSGYKSWKPINNCRLVYLFIMQPELFPLYLNYLTRLEFTESPYMQWYYNRAALFYVAEKHPDLSPSWIEGMEPKYFTIIQVAQLRSSKKY